MSAAEWALIALGVALLSLLLTWAHYRFWVARYTVHLPYELEERVPTSDGSAVELRRLPMPEHAERGGPPILMVHGLALNHRNNDMLEHQSLARHLAAKGRDVWLLTLRSGRSDLGFRESRRVRFDCMVDHDIPLGVREVLRRTGADRLDYVGFSMGGMLAYASLGRRVPSESVRKVVILGSPARLKAPFAFMRVLRFLPRALTPTLPLRVAGRMSAFAAEWWITPFHRLVYNPENVEPGIAAISLVNGFVNMPGPLNAEFAAWVGHDAEVQSCGAPVVDALAQIDLPVLFIAGAADRLAPPASVRHAFDHWGSRVETPVEKRFLEVSIEGGAAADYGHGDLVVGRFAAEDVFEPVAEFLAP